MPNITGIEKVKDMSSKYSLLYKDEPRESDDDSLPSLPDPKPRRSWRRILGISVFIAAFLALYTFAVCRIQELFARRNHVPVPLAYFPHPDEMVYEIKTTGLSGITPIHKLAFDEPSPEADEAWYDLLMPFNTKVPDAKFKHMNRTSVNVMGSSDKYVTLTVYHEIHCLMRFKWFLYPEYYENKTWAEQLEDPHIVGHFKHCIWSMLESILCHGDTSIRTFHWDPTRPGPIADSPSERKCVNWDWFHKFTMENSFLLEDHMLGHPVFGQLNEHLMPIHMAKEQQEKLGDQDPH
ncbi:hypothetical protein OQA88_9511 [Cercophora sp. LCS_1]